MWKKWAAFLMAAIVCLGGCAAQAEEITLTGQIVPGDTITVKAPYGGTVEDFALRAGDKAAAGELLVPIATDKVYASCDGTVSGLFAGEGDSAALCMERYGALVYIQPESEFLVSATTDEAYDNYKNRYVRIGEKVYLESSINIERNGEGVIIAVDGNGYIVEVTGGTLRYDERCSIHRDGDYSESSRLGRGTVSRNPAVGVSGGGYVLRVCVQEGQKVKKGDLLFEMVDTLPAAQKGGEEGASAAEDMIITSVLAQAGGRVSEGQPVATGYAADGMRIALMVSEYDLANVQEGDLFRVTLDCDEERAYRAEVESVSFTPVGNTGEATYIVYLEFENDGFAREGMAVTARKTE